MNLKMIFDIILLGNVNNNYYKSNNHNNSNNHNALYKQNQ